LIFAWLKLNESRCTSIPWRVQRDDLGAELLQQEPGGVAVASGVQLGGDLLNDSVYAEQAVILPGGGNTKSLVAPV
jgi:hypothetical protein